MLKASEDKTFPGATAASLASPWGQAVPAGQPASDGLAPYFGSYREVFPRDAYETFTGFLVGRRPGTARQMVRYWFDDMQLPNGAFPRNGLLNGKAAPDTGGLQLDETADPILAAWQAGMAGDTALYAGPHQAGRRLPGGERPGRRGGALGGADRVLAVHHGRRGGRPGRGRGDRAGAGRHRVGSGCSSPPRTTSGG